MATDKEDRTSDAPAEDTTEGAVETPNESDPPESADEEDADGEEAEGDDADGADAEGADAEGDDAEAEAARRRRRKRKHKEGEDPSSSSKKRRKKTAGGKQSKAEATQRKRSKIVAGVVAAAIVLLVIGVIATGKRGGKAPGAPPQNAWTVGKEYPIEITLVAADRTNLACASDQAVAGKHCAFEAPTKQWSKGGGTDDKSLLKPYTTLDRRNLLAAGMWTNKVLIGTLPRERFSVKCTFAVEGQVKKPHVRWEANGEWIPNDPDWFAGTVKDCTLVK